LQESTCGQFTVALVVVANGAAFNAVGAAQFGGVHVKVKSGAELQIVS
jgi:hypothetical protein